MYFKYQNVFQIKNTYTQIVSNSKYRSFKYKNYIKYHKVFQIEKSNISKLYLNSPKVRTLFLVTSNIFWFNFTYN